MTPAEHASRRRARIHRIRVRVATLTVTLFIAVFAVIYVQMVQGHDPALSKNTTTSASSAPSSSSDEGFDQSDQGSGNTSPAPVQTTQS
jgi:hypothetical protein